MFQRDREGEQNLLGGANSVTAQFNLLQAVDGRVQVEVDVAPVRYEKTLARIGDSLLLDIKELLEEGRHVEDHARADQVDAALCDEAGGEEVEVVGDAIGLDGMTGVVTTLSTLRISSKSINDRSRKARGEQSPSKQRRRTANK